jgi:chitodextrinase
MGHALTISNFPTPGSTFYGLTMGSNIQISNLETPSNLMATPGNRQVTLSWTAPSDAGSSAVDHYIVYQNGIDVSHPTTTSATITGLTNGQRYPFTVGAHNSGGVSAHSSSQTISPKEASSIPGATTSNSALTSALLCRIPPS